MKMYSHLLPLLFLLWHACSCQDLACFADYFKTLTCLWKCGSGTCSRAQYNLRATWDCDNGSSCDFRLTASGNADGLHFTCFSDQKHCFANNIFNVTVTKVADELRKDIRFSKAFEFNANIKPHPPFNLTATASPDGYNISWRTRYQDPEYRQLDGELQYELRYWKRAHPLQGPSRKSLFQDVRSVWLSPQDFEGDAEYEVQVRAGVGNQSDYEGTWSNWSPLVTLRTLPVSSRTRGPKWLLMLPLLILGPFALSVVLGCHHRWKKLNIFIPSPAPFFQPLYLIHGGNVKDWVGTSCARVTLEVFEWTTALPEVLEAVYKHLPPSTTKEGWEGSQPALRKASTSSLMERLQASSAGDVRGMPEHPYGHLSIDTVMVANEIDPCGPPYNTVAPGCDFERFREENEGYGSISVEDSSNETISGSLFLENVVPQSHSFPSGSGGGSTFSVFLQAKGFLDRKFRESLDLFLPHAEPSDWGDPVCLSSPSEDPTFDGDLPSPGVGVDGDPVNSLDLDTVDSGFVDSDCESPVVCEFEGSPTGCGQDPKPGRGEEGGGSTFQPNYVKQWLSISGLNRTPPT